ncbi:MAG TPA: AmmeMemoRadiSam system protein B [Tepidiformaceae bacterium]|nr:AmmeMemoRadiSam system protein B [Tepidiformaceae bacterium]
MATRAPAVAGTFYEGSPERLRAQVDACSAGNRISDPPEPFIAGVVPHAGLMYSGHVAAAFYDSVALPSKFIILCPNHTGLGHVAAINREGSWETPLGEVPVDTELADALMSRTRLLAEDWRAHAREHSLEVQLPFLQRKLARFTFVPICLATHRLELCEEVGRAVADVVRSSAEPVAILASSDLNHYEDQKETMRKDSLAIDAVLKLDPEELWRVVKEFDVSMCGFIPTTAMLFAARELGASGARLLKHATSGDINRDYSQVVGYAAIVVQGARGH